MISPIHEPIIQTALTDVGIWDVYQFYPHYHYVCPMETALAVTYDVPDYIILRPLTTDNSAEVDAHLSYKSPKTEDYVRTMIEFMPSIGAFRRDTGELIAWVLNYLNESHSALTVKPEYRRQGLARLLAKKLMLDRARQGKVSHCHIMDGNVASENLFNSLGFQRTYPVNFGGPNGRTI